MHWTGWNSSVSLSIYRTCAESGIWNIDSALDRWVAALVGGKDRGKILYTEYLLTYILELLWHSIETTFPLLSLLFLFCFSPPLSHTSPFGWAVLMSCMSYSYIHLITSPIFFIHPFIPHHPSHAFLSFSEKRRRYSGNGGYANWRCFWRMISKHSMRSSEESPSVCFQITILVFCQSMALHPRNEWMERRGWFTLDYGR